MKKAAGLSGHIGQDAMASINEISKAVQKTLKLFSMLQASIKAIGLGVDENAIKDKADNTLAELVGQLSLVRNLLKGDTAFARASGQSRQYLTYSGVSWHEVALRAVSDFLRDIYIASVYDFPIDNDAKANFLLDLPAVLPVCSWSTEAIQKCGVLDANVDKLLADVRSELVLATKSPDDSADKKDTSEDKNKKLPRNDRTRACIQYINAHRQKVAKGKAQYMSKCDLIAEFAGNFGVKEVERLKKALTPSRHGHYLLPDIRCAN